MTVIQFEDKLARSKRYIAERNLAPSAKRVPAVTASHQFRAFAGASVNRLTESWLGTLNSIDQDLRGDLDKLRQRSSEAAQNNEYVKKFLGMCGRNIVGPVGFILQPRVVDDGGQPDTLANKAIERAFWNWGKRGSCEITGRMTFVKLCRTVVESVARDGEALIHIVRGKAAKNREGFALQLLDVARLDTNFNLESGASRNAVIMGVEIDAYRRPLAYWLFDRVPNGPRGPGQRVRIPAADMIHIFDQRWPEQTRGIPWTHAALVQLHHLKAYRDAAVIAAQIGAKKMGFYTTPDGAAPGSTPEGWAAKDMPAEQAESGTFEVLPAGTTFESFNPDYPHQLYDAFVKAGLRGVATGLDVSYNNLANDLEGVNFSSIRHGMMDERDQWLTLQSFTIDEFLDPVHALWLPLALLNGTVVLPNGSPLPFAKLDKFSEHVWQGRRWAHVNPMQDMEAARLQIKTGVASPQTIAAASGVDVNEIIADLADFEARVRASGLTSINLTDAPGLQLVAPAKSPSE